jgi:hypothetical protein
MLFTMPAPISSRSRDLFVSPFFELAIICLILSILFSEAPVGIGDDFCLSFFYK